MPDPGRHDDEAEDGDERKIAIMMLMTKIMTIMMMLMTKIMMKIMMMLMTMTMRKMTKMTQGRDKLL